MIAAKNEFGFGALDLEVEDFMTPNDIIQLNYEPYRIDILLKGNGVDFERVSSDNQNNKAM